MIDASFLGLKLMRAIAGGVSAGSSLAVAHRLLSLFESPPLDLLLENSYLGAVPQTAWDRLVAKRTLPRTFLSKAVRVLVKNCREDDRSSVGESDSVIWLGFIGADFLPMIELSNPESDAVEIDFGEDQLPFADALVQVAQDHFVFYSAKEGPAEAPAQESGSGKLSERV